MAAKNFLNEDIASISLHNVRPVLFHGYVGPFIIFYTVWIYVWATVFGIQEYPEVGFIVLAIIAMLQVLCCLFCHWSVAVKCFMICVKALDAPSASWVRVTPTPNNGSSELVKLNHTKDSFGEEIWFIFRKTKYVYDREEKKQFQTIQQPVNLTIQEYFDWKGYADEEMIKEAERKYDKNAMTMDIPTFMDLFKERATAPFFVFQVFCVSLWCLDEYWYYSIFTLFMLIAFEATLVTQQLRNMAEIRKMGNKPYMIQVCRNRKWRQILSDELLPGDIVSIVRSNDEKLVPCDLLLLRGPCIVDESMLTGESVPVMKEAVEELDGKEETNLDILMHGKLHVLFGGTKIVQHSPPSKTTAGVKSPDNGCIGYVLRTSFNTSQGKLLKTILYGVKRVTANNLETFMFILFLFIFAISASAYVWIKGTENPERNRYKLFLECTLILTSVVPPELPIELSLAVNSSLLALTKLHVFCTEPFRIPFAGKIDICCFDKTGTLTSDNLVVEGIAGLSSDKSLTPVADVPLETVQVLATCHALVQLDDDLIGDPLEKATLNAVEWNLTKGEAVVPRKMKTHGLKIFHRYHFSSALKRMSVIAGNTPHGSVEAQYIASVKGAPETLRNMFSKVPDYYDSVYLEMSRRGARVLALGHKSLGKLSHQQVREMKRDSVESELNFVGFVIISCPLKSDSKAVIKEIMHASHHVVMITGDNPLTACHVAQELKMIRKQNSTLILTGPNQSDPEWHWQSIDDAVTLPVVQSPIKAFISSFDLCITGESLTHLSMYETKFFKKILQHVKVYARVAPKQKEFVVTSLKDQGFVTLMCGDGTNDVGALKHSHVGVALLSNAPEKIPEKKKKKEITEESSVDAENTLNNKMPANLRGKPSGKAAKRQAIARGDNLAPTQKRLQSMLKDLEEEEKASVVRLGDASIASPFTSKLSTTMCTCHIIKQGRCTLVTTLQMFKILALNALILAYSQSVLYLEGVKYSDSQATMQGLLLAGCFLFISRSKPLKVLSKQRPLPTIFNFYTILTVLCQFAVHFTSIVHLYTEAWNRSPAREGKFADLEADFKPNLLNSTMYIISMAMQINTFAINYRGHPFMESLVENKPLLYSLCISGGTVIGLSSGLIPDLAVQFEIVEFPIDMRNILVQVLAADLLTCFVIDRTLRFFLDTGKLR